jgi:hypothetical protein
MAEAAISAVLRALAISDQHQANSSAEYGFKGGARVNMITKHGGSGPVTGIWRHEQFNSQNFFNNRSGATTLPLRRSFSHPGGPVPIRIPV